MRNAFRLIGNHYGYLLPRQAQLTERVSLLIIVNCERIKKSRTSQRGYNPQKINKNKNLQ